MNKRNITIILVLAVTSIIVVRYVIAHRADSVLEAQEESSSTYDVTGTTVDQKRDSMVGRYADIGMYVEMSDKEFSSLGVCLQKQLHNDVTTARKLELFSEGNAKVIVYATPNIEGYSVSEFMDDSICGELGSETPLAIVGGYQLWWSQLGCGFEVGEIFENSTAQSDVCSDMTSELLAFRGQQMDSLSIVDDFTVQIPKGMYSVMTLGIPGSRANGDRTIIYNLHYPNENSSRFISLSENARFEADKKYDESQGVKSHLVTYNTVTMLGQVLNESTYSDELYAVKSMYIPYNDTYVRMSLYVAHDQVEEDVNIHVVYNDILESALGNIE